MIGRTTLGQLPFLRDYKSRRASSFDTTGGNRDFWIFEPGQTREIFRHDSTGCIKHLWMTVGGDDTFTRAAILRIWWDDESSPSVEVPLGDFFGMGHGILRNFCSAPLQMSPDDGRGMNCWWPMPYDSCRIEVESECSQPINIYFYIDYEEYFEPIHALNPFGTVPARFHAQWRRENPTNGDLKVPLHNEDTWQGWDARPNSDHAENYLILEAKGNGAFVGCHMSIDCFSRQGNDWYGEGDDMIVIDDEPWPPRLHGTGTEDYFCTAFGPRTEFNAPYHGITLYSGTCEWPWRGKNHLYRYHIEDPIRFYKSIRVSIEHGHGNKLTNDYSSTAYWYQMEPHGSFPVLLPVAQRMPRPNEPNFP